MKPSSFVYVLKIVGWVIVLVIISMVAISIAIHSPLVSLLFRSKFLGYAIPAIVCIVGGLIIGKNLTEKIIILVSAFCMYIIVVHVLAYYALAILGGM